MRNELDNNMRLTSQRQVILEELRKVKSHPTANQVYDMVRKRLPRIGLGTVYRNLDLLAEKGSELLQRRHFPRPAAKGGIEWAPLLQ